MGLIRTKKLELASTMVKTGCLWEEKMMLKNKNDVKKILIKSKIWQKNEFVMSKKDWSKFDNWWTVMLQNMTM